MASLSFSEISGKWDKPVYLIGGGTSLSGFNFSKLNGLGITVGVNKAAWLLGTDVFFTLDQTLVRNCREEIIDFIEQGGDAYLAMPANDDMKQIPGATYVVRDRGNGLNADKGRINGLNSGYGALGLAYHKGASEIALLGYDMQAGDKSHWHNGYKWHNKGNHKYYPRWANNFDKAARQLDDAGVNVVNFVGNPESRIPSFVKQPLGDIND